MHGFVHHKVVALHLRAKTYEKIHIRIHQRCQAVLSFVGPETGSEGSVCRLVLQSLESVFVEWNGLRKPVTHPSAFSSSLSSRPRPQVAVWGPCLQAGLASKPLS